MVYNYTCTTVLYLSMGGSKQNHTILFAAEEFMPENEIVLAAVRRDDRALRYAAEEIKVEREIISISVTENGDML